MAPLWVAEVANRARARDRFEQLRAGKKRRTNTVKTRFGETRWGKNSLARWPHQVSSFDFIRVGTRES